MPEREERILRARLVWAALPWRKFTCCAECGEFLWCCGRYQERMLCETCYVANEERKKLRRGGSRGKRSGYAYRDRRPQEETLVRVCQLRERGLVVGAIARELGLSEKSVRNYLSKLKARGWATPENRPAEPLPEREDFPRKEDGVGPAVPAFVGRESA